MSDISITPSSMTSISVEDISSGVEGLESSATSTVMSGENSGGSETQEFAVAGTEVASRTQEYLGAGTDFSSTGTDIDFAQSLHTNLLEGHGAITDKII